MLEQPEYYLAQLALPADERAPEMRTALYLGKVLTSALLELQAAEKQRDEALEVGHVE